jgi:hypothetical protein
MVFFFIASLVPPPYTGGSVSPLGIEKPSSPW